MTERDLERLKDLAVPASRETAKRAALDTALVAFDKAHPAGAPLGVSDAPMESSTQGNIIPLRQTETSKRKRSFLMSLSTRQSQAIAASVAALVIAAPIAFQQMGKVDLPAPTFNNVGTAINSPEHTVALQAPPPPPQPSAAVARRYDGAGGRDETQIAMGEVSKAKPDAAAEPSVAQLTPPTTPPSSNDAWRYEGGKNNVTETKDEAAKHIVPPDLAGKSQLGINGQERRFADPTDGLGVIGSAGPARPWNAPDSQSLASAPAPATTPAEGKVAAVAPPPAAAAPAIISDGYARDLGVTLDSHSKFTGQAAPARLDAPRLNAELGRRMMERDASNPAAADPSKPNPYSWMGRVEQEKAIVVEENRDKFDAREINPVKQVATEPVSTFSIDVDTASYAFVRRALNAGHLPPKDAVRVEEMVNYFPYAYPAPDSAETPFKPTVTVMPSPWNPNNKLVHVAIKGYDLTNAERPRANIVLLMDVSGSMEPEDRLPLVKNAFRMLVDQLKPDDTIAIVTYASGSGIALEPTKVADKWKILSAIDRLGAGGSTAGAAGISDAYRLAEAGFDKSAVNRIILATDGDFNVGITDQNELKSYIERKRQSGIFLSILGVGQGNHNDALMQTLAQNGNGTASYVDTLNEARKVLVDETSSTLFTIAKDVKVQIEWNPARVAEYRLIGYETRNLRREDFNNDKVDAGDIGSGHTVTAIYEVTPVGAPVLTDDLRYGNAAAKATIRDAATPATMAGELGFLKLRYKKPNEDVSQLITVPMTDAMSKASLNEVPVEQRFSAAVAAFGQLMKGEPYTQGYSFDNILELAQSARGNDPFGYRNEFLNLVRLAKTARP
jgi:Ca-activated chloride channel homolog